VAGVCVSLASTNYVFAGMVRTDSGIMTGMSVAPAVGIILNNANLVNAMALENLGPDSFVTGGLELSDGTGIHAYLLRVNTLYYSVLCGMRYIVRDVHGNGSDRRLLRDTTMFSSTGKGLVIVDDTLYMIVEYSTAHNTTALSVLHLQMATGTLINQAHLASDAGSISCTDIIYADLHLIVACTVQYHAPHAQSILLSVDKDLTFSKLPIAFKRDENRTVVAERVLFQRTVLPMSVQSASLNPETYTFRTAVNDTVSRLPTVPPTGPPSMPPSVAPSGQPSSSPTSAPSISPQPTSQPSTSGPTNTYKPTVKPTQRPSAAPSRVPSMSPSRSPTTTPTVRPTVKPSASPSALPSIATSPAPSRGPSCSPTRKPSAHPTARLSSSAPSEVPTVSPTTEVKSAGASALPTQHLVLIIIGAVGGTMVFILLLHQLYNMFLSCVWMVVKEERRMEFAIKYDDAAGAKPRWWYLCLHSCIACIFGAPRTKALNTVGSSASKETSTLPGIITDVSSSFQGQGAYAEGPTTAPFLDLEANIPHNANTSDVHSDLSQSAEAFSQEESVYVSSESTYSQSQLLDTSSELSQSLMFGSTSELSQGDPGSGTGSNMDGESQEVMEMEAQRDFASSEEEGEPDVQSDEESVYLSSESDNNNSREGGPSDWSAATASES